MLDACDADTAGHTLRVAAVADLLADRLGIEPNARAALRLAAAVHDYGKLGTPDSLLNKRALLTGNERVEMERHVILTARFSSTIEFPHSLQDVPRIACEHRERYDGSGYPDGRAGDGISLEGRILGTADVIDAMTSGRPYRAAVPLVEALDYLVTERGRMFDPDVVDACVASQAEIQRLHAEMAPAP